MGCFCSLHVKSFSKITDTYPPWDVHRKREPQNSPYYYYNSPESHNHDVTTLGESGEGAGLFNLVSRLTTKGIILPNGLVTGDVIMTKYDISTSSTVGDTKKAIYTTAMLIKAPIPLYKPI